ncbi:kinetochore protein SPC25 homolog isoform X2 [Prosopis cineraria]|uniref:kinetochore protein SPC25 homolog isoform X2 n=1 Tax=Prosopis cineraria TaxID=364024 RepID=UPI002410747A|nr:kinetochore protein SPC25 homolog isoform X2 [Prosopis cineraria]
MAESVRQKMESGRLICDTEIPVLQHKIDVFSSSYLKSLESLRARSQETAQYQGFDLFYGFPAKSEEAKAKLREVEDDLVKALGVKTRKEAKRMALMDAVASAKTRVEDLKNSVQEQRTKNCECAAILSQHSLASEGTMDGSSEQKDEILEAISWYNTVLGFHVEGVKFTFKNINVNNPSEECFFTIRHENDTYTLLNCKPSLNGTKEFIHELNKTNGLFKYVRVMRRKFQEAVAQGSVVSLNSEHQESAIISTSAPDLSMSSFRSDSPSMKSEDEVQPTKGDRPSKKQTLGRRVISAAISPGSASSVRQSSRLKAKKSSQV